MSLPDNCKTVYFVEGSSESEWYKNLNHHGSCLSLMTCLKNNPLLLKQTGRGGTTVLHKAVRHGCNDLIKQVFKMFDDTGKAFHDEIDFTLEDLLSETNAHQATAIMIAAMHGTRDVVTSFNEVIESMRTRKIIHAGSQKSIHPTDDYECSVDYSGICKVEDGRIDVQANISSTNGPSISCTHTVDSDEDHSARIGNISRGHSRSLEPFPDSESSDTAEEEIASPSIARLKRCAPINKTYYTTDEEITQENDFALLCKFIRQEILERVDDTQVQHLIALCESNSSFDFKPTEEIFFHFLCGLNSQDFPDVLPKVCNEIVFKVFGHDRSLLTTLFLHRDPRGRTPLHVVIDNHNSENLMEFLDLIPRGEDFRCCVNARDDAGRTPLHRACIASSKSVIKTLLTDGRMDLNARVRPPHYEELAALLNWRCQEYNDTYEEDEHCTALHLAVLHGNSDAVSALLKFDKHKRCQSPLDVNACLRRGFYRYGGLGRTPPNILRLRVSWNGGFWGTPMQLAARLGYTKILEMLLKDERSMDQGKLDMSNADRNRFGKTEPYDMSLPALHWAARAGEAETVQSLLRNRRYDPLTTDRFRRSALHVAVTITCMEFEMLCIQDLLPYGHTGKLRRAFKKQMPVKPRDYTGDETVCIGLLLREGIDIWIRDRHGEIASPGPNASKEATKWWFNTVNDLVNDYKINYVSAATNATSVVATLVATASFIGPLQPPLGYDSDDGYVYANRLPVRMYLVCNGLSFYLSMTVILIAITFGFPKPRDSTESGMRRSRRVLTLIVKLLVVSLVCLILSFSAACVAVIPSEWRDRRLVLISMLVGGGVFFILCLYFFFFRYYRTRLYWTPSRTLKKIHRYFW